MVYKINITDRNEMKQSTVEIRRKKTHHFDEQKCVDVGNVYFFSLNQHKFPLNTNTSHIL